MWINKCDFQPVLTHQNEQYDKNIRNLFKDKNKDSRTTLSSVWCLSFWIWRDFTHCSGVSSFDFEQELLAGSSPHCTFQEVFKFDSTMQTFGIERSIVTVMWFQKCPPNIETTWYYASYWWWQIQIKFFTLIILSTKTWSKWDKYMLLNIGIIYLGRMQDFPKFFHFLQPDTHMYVHVLRGKKWQFFGWSLSFL